jgi:hypothetical protein
VTAEPQPGTAPRTAFEHAVHPWRRERAQRGPVKVTDQHPRGNRVTRFNTRLALATTKAVGSMWCAYAFAAFDCLALPEAIAGGMFGMVQWVASFLLQLVLLSIIMVGQDVQAKAADARAESTFKDAEAILHAADQIAEHLTAQDAHLIEQDGKLTDLVAAQGGQFAELTTLLTALHDRLGDRPQGGTP